MDVPKTDYTLLLEELEAVIEARDSAALAKAIPAAQPIAQPLPPPPISARQLVRECEDFLRRATPPRPPKPTVAQVERVMTKAMTAFDEGKLTAHQVAVLDAMAMRLKVVLGPGFIIR